MKIGILTYSRDYTNLGTNMQCYCTLRAIQAAYPDAHVELVDYSTRITAKQFYLFNLTLRSLKNDCVRKAKYDTFFGQELRFSRETLITHNVDRALNFIKRQRYDAIYVGSDTVLELKGAAPDRLTPYWLDSAIPGAKFLAAASSLNVTAEALSTRQKYLIQRALDGFNMLGVRDDATFRLLSNFVGPSDRRLEIVPDPTFTYQIDYSYIERYLAMRHMQITKPLVCLHLLRDSTWAGTLANYFRRAGYLVASLRPAYYADVLFTDLSPFEQMGLYKYFSIVITHRFHDAVFCLKSLTPVIVFPEHASDVTSLGESKIATLLRTFNAEDTCYIQNKEKLRAEYIFDRHFDAMSYFAMNGANIKLLLTNQREQYESYVKRSRCCVK